MFVIGAVHRQCSKLFKSQDFPFVLSMVLHGTSKTLESYSISVWHSTT